MLNSSTPRLWAIQEVTRRQDRSVPYLQAGNSRPISAIFGENTFGNAVMQAKLPKAVFEKLQEHHRTLHRQDPPLTQAEAIVIAKRLRELKKELGIYGLGTKTPRDLQTPRDAAA